MHDESPAICFNAVFLKQAVTLFVVAVQWSAGIITFKSDFIPSYFHPLLFFIVNNRLPMSFNSQIQFEI